MANFTRNRIMTVIKLLGDAVYRYRRPAGSLSIAPGSYSYGQYFRKEDHSFRPFGRDETWGGEDRHFWFVTDVDTSSFEEGRPAVLLLGTNAVNIWNTNNPQVLGYINGEMKATLDMNHTVVHLTESFRPGEAFEAAFYAYSNIKDSTNFFHLDSAVKYEEVEALYYDMKLVFDAGVLLEEDDLEAIKIWKALNGTVNELDLREIYSKAFLESIGQARRYLKENYYDKRPEDERTVYSVGHTHIDVAWKWPLRQTRQKAVRSFQTVLNLMDRYPEYRFMSSSPELYEFVREDAPWLFPRIKERIREGRWECEGGMWLEADCNLTSGESLVRQFLYGTRYFKEVLGSDASEVLWLPDVFGYSAALPQIMKGFGIKYFMTTKISWSDTNEFPYDTFIWRGIDGSEVLAHLITTTDYTKVPGERWNTTYNGFQNASQIAGTWQRYHGKAVSNDTLTCYGHGDGGGGTTEEMLENSRRLEHSLGRLPKVRHSTVREFFHALDENLDRKALPSWSGELYLEYHRGTYTSIAENKRLNRKSEFLLETAEQLSVLSGSEYPAEELGKAWRTVLLNQFHDILPGSSIKEVYDDSWKQYGEVMEEGERIISKALSLIAGPEGPNALVYNPCSFTRSSIAVTGKPLGNSQRSAEGSYLSLVTVPGLGYAVVKDGEKAGKDVLTVKDGKYYTEHAVLEFDKSGFLSSVYDRDSRREVLKGKGNRLRVFEDRPMEFDNWNIECYYTEKSWDMSELTRFEVIENGPVRAAIRQERKFLSSTVAQTIYLYAHTARIDFKTEIDWHNDHLLLKAEFPFDILTDKASYGIQFGSVERPTHQNTSWDRAKFEVCHHRWADVAEPGYGAAILNDSRYGISIQGSTAALTLLKSGTFPDIEADQGCHETVYSLFPHKGGFREGHVVEEAYDLNQPFLTESTARPEATFSFLTLDGGSVFAETVKQAEDGDGIIVRLYEAEGYRCESTPLFSAGWEITETSLAESGERPVTLPLLFRPYEIKTLRLRRKHE